MDAKEQIALIRELIKGKVDYKENPDENDLIDCIYYDADQDYTIIGTNDYHEGALNETIYKMRTDQRFDLDRFLNNNLH